jgi:hypothetical protein
MATVCPDDAAVLRLGMLFDDVAELSNQHTGFYGLDSLVQALSCRLNHAHAVGVRLGSVADVVRLVEIGMIALVVQGDINIEDISVEQDSLVGYAVADDLVDRCAARLGKVVVI